MTSYNLLEKFSELKSAVYSYHHLHIFLSSLHDNFKSKTTTFQRETYKHNITESELLNLHLKRVEVLEVRMRDGIKRTLALNHRLDSAQKQVDLWNQKENWQVQMSQVFRIFGVVIIVFLFIIPFMLITEKLRANFQVFRL